MARGPALPLLCAPAVWAATALLLCTPQTSGRTSVPAWLSARVHPFLRHHTRAAASLSAPLLSLAPPPGLLPVRRAPGRDKCFQRPGGLRQRPRGAPRPWFSRIVSVNMARPWVLQTWPLFLETLTRPSPLRLLPMRLRRSTPTGPEKWAPDPRRLAEQGFGFPFVGPFPLPHSREVAEAAYPVPGVGGPGRSLGYWGFCHLWASP